MTLKLTEIQNLHLKKKYLFDMIKLAEIIKTRDLKRMLKDRFERAMKEDGAWMRATTLQLTTKTFIGYRLCYAFVLYFRLIINLKLNTNE